MNYKFKQSSKFYITYKDAEFIILGEPIQGYAAVKCTSDPNVRITRYVNTSDLEVSSVSIKNMGANVEQHDMDISCSDPCPVCRGHMKVGDWVCWGFCFNCYDRAVKDDN